MKFAADCMLGTLLTCDRRLVLRRDARDHILIESQDLRAQIRQVLAERGLPIRKDRLFRRCIKCNRATRPVSRPSVRLEVPPYVYRTRRRFTRCPACRQVFWRATHVRRMLEDLKARVGPLKAAAPGHTSPPGHCGAPPR